MYMDLYICTYMYISIDISTVLNGHGFHEGAVDGEVGSACVAVHCSVFQRVAVCCSVYPRRQVNN